MSIPPLGWIAPQDRTPLMLGANDDALGTMPRLFKLDGVGEDPGPYVHLMELWKHPEVVKALGFEFPGVKQITGSCVGAGGGNVCFSLSAVEVIRLKEREQIILPFWLFTYGKSRELLGERSEGEGSLGSTFARAAKEFGIFSNHESGLPTPSNTDGLVWGQATEMKWSNGTAIASNWVEVGRRHLVRSTAPIKSSKECRDALANLYPVTFACLNFMTPGAERVIGSGADAACVGSLSTRGPHQTSIQGYWDHPSLGLLLWNENQWARNTYKIDPKTGRSSGCWMTAKDFDNAIRSLDAEVFAFSQHDGYPAQKIDVDWSDLGNW